MPLIRLDKVSINFGTQVILEDVNLSIKRGQKLGLLGRNGTGKSTLMKLIADDIKPDGGERWLRSGTKVSWLEQNLPLGDKLTVYDMVASGLEKTGELLKRYHHLITDYSNERQMVFLSSNPELEHHELFLTAGRNTDAEAKIIQQISFHVDSLEEVRQFHERFIADEVTIDSIVTHGNTASIYFRDPELNRLEKEHGEFYKPDPLLESMI